MPHAPADDIYDITIIGGGPVGLFAAFYAGLRHMRTKIIDSLEELGGQLTTLYPEKYIYDVPGFPRILARDLANNLIEQALQYHPAVCLGETVTQVAHEADQQLYRITTGKAQHLTRTAVLCAGAGAFQAKKLPLPDTEKWDGKGIYYFVRTKSVFAGKRVLIVGGGDSAVDWALNLQDTASHVTVIHRRNVFRAHEDSVRKLQKTDAQILTFFELKALVEEHGTLTGAVIVNNQTQEERTLAIDAILVQVGFISSLGPLRHWPVKIQGSSILVNAHMQTNMPGIFAAGDVALYDGKLKLIATGFGEAAIAVNYAKTLVDPASRAFPGHSSELTPQEQSVVKL